MLTRVRSFTTTALIASLMLGATAAHATIASTTSSTTPTSTTRTSTTRTTTTTSTTLPPTTFSPATKACIKHLEANKKICKSSGSSVDCKAEFYAMMPTCFAPKGATAVASCTKKATSCDAKATVSETDCLKSCKKSPDPSCKPSCKSFAAVCKAAFTACLLKCPML